MPWNQNSGGPWGGGGNRGPWGQRPSGGGGGGGGPQPPDLEELIRQSQDKLKNMLPRGGRSGALGALVALGVIGALWLNQAVYSVGPDEVGIELLFGKAKEGPPEQPGLHFHFWPFETVELPKIRKENQENIGFSAGSARGDRRSGDSESLMLTGDQNIVDIQFTVLWRIKDGRDFLFNVRDPQEVVRTVAESAMREHVGHTPADNIRTVGREEAQEAVRILIQGMLDHYRAGIEITGVKLERADPPPAVIDAFEEVQRAEQDRTKFVEEASRYANEKLGQARGDAARIREEAAGYRDSTIAEAQGEAKRFSQVYEEYAKAKDVTRKRLFLETMERVLKRSNKIIIEGDAGSGVIPYLPLPEISGRRAAPNSGQ